MEAESAIGRRIDGQTRGLASRVGCLSARVSKIQKFLGARTSAVKVSNEVWMHQNCTRIEEPLPMREKDSNRRAFDLLPWVPMSTRTQ